MTLTTGKFLSAKHDFEMCYAVALKKTKLSI